MSGCDEMAQPWARQSLVQLAPVWGRITDPQTVQTTTSVHSQHRLPTIQQLLFRSGPAAQQLHTSQWNDKFTIGSIPWFIVWPKTQALQSGQEIIVWIINKTCESTYHQFCWNCRPQYWQHVYIWSDPHHTFYCRGFSWVCHKHNRKVRDE